MRCKKSQMLRNRQDLSECAQWYNSIVTMVNAQTFASYALVNIIPKEKF